ncbi:hypothetical protein GCM10010376_80890 [Streptomyces violaceusniger]
MELHDGVPADPVRTDPRSGGIPDGGIPDGGIPDDGAPSGSIPDADTPDGGAPDADTPDADTPDGHLPADAVPSGSGTPVGGPDPVDRTWARGLPRGAPGTAIQRHRRITGSALLRHRDIPSERHTAPLTFVRSRKRAGSGIGCEIRRVLRRRPASVRG